MHFSLKALLGVRKASRARDGWTRNASPHIPDDILLEISHHISSLGTILDLSLLSKHTRGLLLPRLYSSVELRTSEQCVAALNGISRCPEVATYIRELVLCPNSRDWAALPSRKGLDEGWVADAAGIIASRGHLSALRSFTWAGMEVPPDGLWLSLQKCCPDLRTVGCNIRGGWALSPTSNLFSFSGLKGFSLVLGEGVLGPMSLLDRLWDMIVDRCPDLQELTIDGGCFLDIQRVTTGRWHRLHSLSLSDVGDPSTFGEFLIAHPTLRQLETTDFEVEPRDLFAKSLPLLDSIKVCSWPPDLQSLTFLSVAHLKRLDLRQDPFLFHQWFLNDTCTHLRLFPSLASLYIRIGPRLHDPDVFHTILSSCPNLTHFEVVSSAPFRISDFSKSLRSSPRLASFVITKPSRFMDEGLKTSALRLARRNPGLKHFTLRHVSPLPYVAGNLLLRDEYECEIIPGCGGKASLITRRTKCRGTRLQTRRCRRELFSS